PTYDLLNRGDTVGVFQLESSGMRDLIRRVGIGSIEDLIAMIALFRPGPMNMLDEYVNRKSGKARISYEHPLLESVCRETYGVMIYQEQVQRAANVLAGYSLGEGDVLRAAMGKKKADLMAGQRDKFIAGCWKTNKIPKKKAGELFDTLEKFAGYGFNKSHSTAYAVVAYRTAYLKANYPAEFMSALLSSEIGNFDKLPVFIAEAAETGLEILPPDVNASQVRFMPEDNGIRYGLAGIKNVGSGAAESVVRERVENGPFSGFIDFCSRLDPQFVNRKAIESLARCGALDCFDLHRARIFNGIDFAMARAASAEQDRRRGQANLFDMIEDPASASAEDEIPECEEWHESELLTGEKELLGVYMSGHPLTRYAGLLQRYQLTGAGEIQKLGQSTTTRTGGIISRSSVKTTKKKESMALIEIEGLDGNASAIVFPDVYRQSQELVKEGAAVMVEGEISERDNAKKLIVQRVTPLSQAPANYTRRISLHLPVSSMEDGKLETVKEIIRMHPGRSPVTLCLQFPFGEKVFVEAGESLRALADEEFLEKLEHELGEEGVYVIPSPPPKPRPRRRFNRMNTA
ncbi:MAG: DNA polymerase III subunit alpha, partial [Kiritimatiellia bacterium]